VSSSTSSPRSRAFKNTGDTRGTFISAIRSTDHGTSWTQKGVTISRFPRGIVRDPDDGAAHRTGDINPEAAVDPNIGAIYVVWQDSSFGPRSSIALSRSTDGGLTWSTPIKVNATPTNIPLGNRQAFTPNVWGTMPARSPFLLRLPQQHGGRRRDHADGRLGCPLSRGDGGLQRLLALGRRDPDDRHVVRQPAGAGRSWIRLGDYEGLGTDGTSFFPFFAMSSATDHANIFTRKVGAEQPYD
jgi:hypothetical protein